MRAVVKVAVIGLGVTGLPLAATIAATKANVIGLDLNPEVVAAVNSGRVVRASDPALPGLVKAQVSAGRLSATADPDALVESDVVVVSVGNPKTGWFVTFVLSTRISRIWSLTTRVRLASDRLMK